MTASSVVAPPSSSAQTCLQWEEAQPCASIHPSSRLLEPLWACARHLPRTGGTLPINAPPRTLSALPTLQRYVCKFLASTSVPCAFECKVTQHRTCNFTSNDTPLRIYERTSGRSFNLCESKCMPRPNSCAEVIGLFIVEVDWCRGAQSASH